MNRSGIAAVILLSAFAASAVGAQTVATKATIEANKKVLDTLPFETDTKDFEWASRGFIANRADPLIKSDNGTVVWDLSATAFLKGNAPDTVNPSLWRNSKLHAMSGLYKAAEGVYQVRGFDLANVTFVRGKTGWIVIDPLTAGESARAAYELLIKHVEDLPISAILYTHSHGDHSGGANGLVEFGIKDMPIIAPAGFMEETISEGVIAGPAMSRRVIYHVGAPLALNAKERVGAGLGIGLARGKYGINPPTQIVSKNGEELTVDGVRMVFQIASGTEAPAEFNIGFPDLGVVNIAENANPTHHNILTPRGAKVRDAKQWSEVLTEAIDMFDYAKVLVVSHGWPVFGEDEIEDYLSNQRDAYAFLHDQTVRMMNNGATLQEIAAKIELPEVLAKQWYNRPYYGDYRFNARAVYQFYLGWFDGNPVNLEPLPPETAGKKYVEAMGGAEAVLVKAQTAFDAGDYQWASELLNKLVFSDGENAKARALLADTYEQMGWQTENALWRNFYLTGVKELREGITRLPEDVSGRLAATIFALPTKSVFDVISTQIVPERMGDKTLTLGFRFTDRNEEVTLEARNGVLIFREGMPRDTYDATLVASRKDFLMGVIGKEPLQQKIASGDAVIEGDPLAFVQFSSWLQPPTRDFNIVTP